MRRTVWALAVFAVSCFGAAEPATARSVDLALVLAVDVSGSIDTDRFELQRQGYAQAFMSPDIIEAIGAGAHHAIVVTLVEWAGARHQRQTIGWTLIEDAASARAFGSAIAEAPRSFADWTSISGAIDYAATLFDKSDTVSERRVIDISGDGINNNGGAVTESRDAAVKAGITINGLPILTEFRTLDAYYHENVIGGPGAFAVPVRDFEGFGAAILSKLVREIAGRDAPPARLTAANR